MSFLKRHSPLLHTNNITEEDDDIDPQLRLRTVRTAASVIAESIRSERRAYGKRSRFISGKGFFRPKSVEKRRASAGAGGGGGDTGAQPATISGRRRNVYVNAQLPLDEQDSRGEPLVRYVRNKVRTTSELLANSTLLSLVDC